MKRRGFVIGAVLLGIAGCNSGSAPPQQAEVPPPASQTQPVVEPPKFRKELFDKVHRAALAFDGKSFPQELQVELKVIEAALESDAEKNVFTLFNSVSELQTSIAAIVQHALTLKETTAFQDITKGAGAIDIARKFKLKSEAELAIAEQAVKESLGLLTSGYVMVDSETDNLGQRPEAMMPIVKKFNLETTQAQRMTWLHADAIAQDFRTPAGRWFTPLRPGRVRLRSDWGRGS